MPERAPDISDVYQPVEAPPALAAEKPASWGELAGAHFNLGQSDVVDADARRLTRGYQPILDALGVDQGQNPGTFYQVQSFREPLLSYSTLAPDQGGTSRMVDRATQEQLIATAIATRRRADPQFLPGVPDSVAGIRQWILKRDQEQRAKDRATIARSPGGLTGLSAGLVGGGGSAMTDPLNIVTLPLGGGGKTLLGIAAREALVNGTIEALEQPIVAGNRAQIGEELTLGEAASNIGLAAAGGAVIGGGAHGAARVGGAAYDKGIEAVFNALPESVQRAWADKMKLGDVKLTDLFAGVPDEHVVSLARGVLGANMTPDEQAAAHVLERGHETEQSSPFTASPAGDDAHVVRLEAARQSLIAGEVPPDPERAPTIARGNRANGEAGSSPSIASGRAAVSTSGRPFLYRGSDLVDSEAAIERFKDRTRHVETSGFDQADNPRSSAQGRFQFTDDTFRRYYRKIYGRDLGAHPPASIKFDVDVQERLMDALTRDHAAQLQALGAPVTEGNLYLLHFAGEKGGAAVLRADPATPIERILSSEAIAANPFLAGQSASQVIAWAHRQMGGQAASVPLRAGIATGGAVEDEGAQVALLRDQALELERSAIGASGDVPAMAMDRFRPAELTVDAQRFQVKSGGDQYGVSDRLAGITEWNPIYAGRVIVWEAADGQRFVADGHQRVGLAKRIEDATGTPINLDAIVLRQADGISAQDARVWAALKNIAEGTGSSVDAAKVIRDAGEHVLKDLPPKSALVRDGRALARLSDEAFGAVYNGVIPADFAAVIGHLLPDNPAAHGAMIGLLAKLDPANRGQAESIIRQALAAGFHKAEQIDLFGSGSHTSSLFLERAKVLERGLARLKKLKLVYGTAAKEADTLEAVGSTIRRKGSEKEATRNAEAIDIVSRLAFRSGPIADALNAAAARLAAGDPIGSVVDEFTNAVRSIDLRAAAKDAGRNDSDRLAPDGAGRGGDAGEADPGLSPQPGGAGQPGLSAGELEDLGQLNAFDLDQAKRFDDPAAGDGAAAQVESLEHDVKMALERPPAGRVDADQVIAGQLGASLEDLHALAIANQAELETFGDELAGALGLRFIRPPGGVKSLERVQQKLADYAEPGEIKDLARGGFAVTERGQGQQIIDALAARFPIYDKGWRPLNGYLDRKVIVQFPNGGVAEIQILPASIVDYKMGAGHALYEKARDPATPWDEFERIVGEMSEVYERLLDGTPFAAIGKAEAKASGESSVPSSTALRASEGEPGTQAPPVNTEALSGPSSRTGLSSSSKNLMESTSAAALDRGANADPGKIARDLQLGELGAAAPLRGSAEQDGTMGLGLFDQADQPGFRLEADGAERSAADLLAGLDDDDKALSALEACLAPGGGAA